MRDHDEDRPRRYQPRDDRAGGSVQFSSRRREGDWKGRRDDRAAEREEAREEERDARDEGRPGARGGRQAASNRPRLEDMDVFRLAHDLVLRIHQLTGRFPPEERSELAALLRRTAAAVPGQLAAGSSRWDRAEYRRGVAAARDLAAEARYYLQLAKDLGHLGADDCSELRDGYDRVSQMLTRLAQALEDAKRSP